jgi:hypothetical protein
MALAQASLSVEPRRKGLRTRQPSATRDVACPTSAGGTRDGGARFRSSFSNGSDTPLWGGLRVMIEVSKREE